MSPSGRVKIPRLQAKRGSAKSAIVPPAEQKVAEMIRYVGRDPQESLGAVPLYPREATIEKRAIHRIVDSR